MTDIHSREFNFTAQDFQRVRSMIYEHAGISLSEGKQELVYSRLSRRLRATGHRSFADYLMLLERGDEQEWQEFVNSLTTNLTAFFREPHHFSLLAEQLKHIAQSHPVVLWCSASSTGEEAYSMAISAIEAYHTLTPPVRIIATDLDTNVLDIARKGVYALDRIEHLDTALVRKYFFRGAGERDGFVKVHPELQNMVTFCKLNLLDANWPIRDRLDAIFCRNVMIYFDKPTQLAILQKMAPMLRSDGLLYAGHSENFYHAEACFKLRGKTVYELSEQMKQLQHKLERP